MGTNPSDTSATDGDISPDQQAAIAMSKTTAKDRIVSERNETLLAGLIGDARSPYTSKFLYTFYDNLGLSYWLIFFASIVLFILIIVLHLPDWLMDVAGIGLALLVVSRFIAKYLKQ